MLECNSRIFVCNLARLIEIEENWPALLTKDGKPISLGITAEVDRPAIWTPVESTLCLPYKKLRKLLDLGQSIETEIEGNAGAGKNAVEALDSLSVPSEFSVQQIINGCAQSLWYAQRLKLSTRFRAAARSHRDAHKLIKSPTRIKLRALEICKTALSINPSTSLAGMLLTTAAGTTSLEDVADIARDRIRLHRVGCMYYQADRLRNQIPSPAALLAFNLEWIFRHWPLDETTFPTWPPRKQQRVHATIKSADALDPRRDIIAHFLNALFPRKDDSYSAETIKNNLYTPKDAQFCGW